MNNKGFLNLLKHELKTRFNIRSLLLSTTLWTLIINGLLALVLFVLPILASNNPNVAQEEFDYLSMGTQTFFQMGSFALSIGVIIMTQNIIFGEKESGTAQWVLSKPVGRNAFLLSKIISSLLFIFTTLLIQYTIGYFIFKTGGFLLEITPFVINTFLISLLNLFFYFSLVFMLSTISKNNMSILGISLGFLFMGLILPNFLGDLNMYIPWILPDLQILTVRGLEIPFNILPVIVLTSVLSISFLIYAVYRFKKYEF